MHESPRPTDEEQELAQTSRMHEEETQRYPYTPADESVEDAEEADATDGE